MSQLKPSTIDNDGSDHESDDGADTNRTDNLASTNVNVDSSSFEKVQNAKKTKQKYITRRLSTNFHMDPSRIRANSTSSAYMHHLVRKLDLQQKVGIQQLIAKFPECPVEIITDGVQSPLMSSLSTSAMKAVSSGWGAMKGLWGTK